MSSQVPWIACVACHCGSTEERGSLVAPVPGHTCRTPTWACLAGIAILTIREVPGWHVAGVHSAKEVAVRAWLAVLVHWAPLCGDDPRRKSGDLEPWSMGRADPYEEPPG